jgi:tRNA modification GTPase
MYVRDTIIALATPTGVGAIGVIRLSGERAIEYCNRVFVGKDLQKQASHTVHFGRIVDEQGIVLDEVLVSLFVAPRSYTRENVVEISCHGSGYILQRVLELLVRQGARLAKAGEFTMRAFLNGQLDLSQAEAVADLIASESEAAHHMAMGQMRGGFGSELKVLREELIGFASLIELELDFGEEDVEFADRTRLVGLVERIRHVLGRLRDSFVLGNAIKRGVSTVIAGRPNAGKSTLLNGLLNEERAIVSEIAGTTRDTIEEILNIEGVQFRLIDTAGIREATDAIEAIGVQKTLEQVRLSSVLVYVFDVSTMEPAEVLADISALSREGLHVMAVANKMDLRRDANLSQYSLGEKVIAVVGMSAIQRDNLETLKQQLLGVVKRGDLQTGGVVVSNIRHYEALEHAYLALTDTLKGLHSGVSADFVAMDIRRALRYMGEITGDISSDDLLEHIFSKFCIGK